MDEYKTYFEYLTHYIIRVRLPFSQWLQNTYLPFFPDFLIFCNC